MSAHVHHQLYYHIVWSTKQRLPFIADEVREWLVERVSSEARRRYAIVLACNAMPDHVHLFVSLPPTVEPARFVGEVKGASSHAFQREYGAARFLKWQMGYSMITLRKNEQKTVIRYIEEQQIRHESGKIWPSLELMDEDDESACHGIEALPSPDTYNHPRPLQGSYRIRPLL